MVGCVAARGLRHAQRIEGAQEIVVLVAGDHRREAGERNTRLEPVGRRDRRPQQGHETVDEPVILDQIAAHHVIGDGAGDQLGGETMRHGGRPVGLAPIAQPQAQPASCVGGSCIGGGGG